MGRCTALVSVRDWRPGSSSKLASASACPPGSRTMKQAAFISPMVHGGGKRRADGMAGVRGFSAAIFKFGGTGKLGLGLAVFVASPGGAPTCQCRGRSRTVGNEIIEATSRLPCQGNHITFRSNSTNWRMKMKNRELLLAFERLMARTGKPVTPVHRNRDRRGPPEQVYKLPNGKTVRVRTNSKAPILMSKPIGYKKDHERPLDAPLTFEQDDYVAAVFPSPNRPGYATAYLIPSDVAGSVMRADMAKWMDADPSHDRSNRTFRDTF